MRPVKNELMMKKNSLLGNSQGIVAVSLRAQAEGFDSLESEKCVHRTETRAQVAEKLLLFMDIRIHSG